VPAFFKLVSKTNRLGKRVRRLFVNSDNWKYKPPFAAAGDGQEHNQLIKRRSENMLTWHDYGYGIQINNLKFKALNTTGDKLRSFIERFLPQRYGIIKKAAQSDWFKMESDEISLRWSIHFGDYYIPVRENESDFEAKERFLAELADTDKSELADCLDDIDIHEPLADIIATAMTQNEKFQIQNISDHKGTQFVILPCTRIYPWNLTPEILEALPSEERLKAKFAEYVSVLTDQTVDDLWWGEHEIENRG
jgi:hypothetical protein